jgi:hypothetical protein
VAQLEYQDRIVLIGILRIPSGGNSSIDFTLPTPASPKRPFAKYLPGNALAPYDSLLIATDEDVFTAAITVRVLVDAAADPEVEANYVTLQSPPGTDVTIAALKAIVLQATCFPALAIFSAGAEADDATFFIYGVQDNA